MTMDDMGIMEQIRALLGTGKSSSEVIAMGYKPGTVYKVQRYLRRSRVTLPDRPVPMGAPVSTPKGGAPTMRGRLDIYPGNGEGQQFVWHPETPVPCPGCGKPVKHWHICPHCNTLIPEGCACPNGSPAIVNGYSLQQIQKALTHR